MDEGGKSAVLDQLDDLDERTPHGIATAVARLVRTGALAPGDRLPTVREVGAALGVSPATVSTAWQILARAGLVASHGRGGTIVLETDAAELRSSAPAPTAGQIRVDLSRGTPDRRLLPHLGRALSRVSEIAETSSYTDLPVIPELDAVLRAGWPTRVESLTVVDGALDAISRALESLVGFGDLVAVESPGFPPILDLVRTLGAEPVAIELDALGATPDSLASALERRPAAVVLQPRAQNPTGASMTAERAEQLARVLGDHPDVVVIEDDHSGQISTAPDVSLAAWLPQQVLHVRSFSKSHGPDLRIAALGGPARLVDPIVARRLLGPGWTSRMVQRILHELLTDEASVAEVAAAKAAYAERQATMRALLAEHGVGMPAADGINLFLPVADESAALVQLAAAGIAVAAGSPFFANGAHEPHVRVTVGLVREDAAAIATALAAASSPVRAHSHSLEHRWN